MEKKFYLLSAVLIIIAFILGFVLGQKYIPKSKTFEAGWQAAKEKLEKSGLFSKGKINIIRGKFDKFVNDRIFTMVTKMKPSNPLADEPPKIRAVNISDNTKIYKIEQKSMAEFQKELQDYRKKMEEYNKLRKEGKLKNLRSPLPPNRSEQKQISIDEFKNFMKRGYLVIVSVNKGDIEYSKKINADKIIIQKK